MSSNPQETKRLCVTYVSGLDLRRVTPATTPLLASAMERYPLAELTNFPSNELFPTLVTGVDPTVHGVFGLKLKPPGERATGRSFLELLPASLATSIQCGLHLVGKTFDLAAIPPRRRARFDITRTKYKRRTKRREALFAIGGIPTVFDVVGPTRSAYHFDSRYDPERSLLPRLCADGNVLEVLELYSLDRHQQWNSDRPEEILRFYGRIDAFLRRLDERCRTRGWRVLLVSDHGHEPIRASHDLARTFASLAIPSDHYDYFIEVSNVRLWFHTEEARRVVTEALRSLPGQMVQYDEMARYGVPLANASYGELFVYLDPGHIFFPHDFHHPLANAWLGITDRMQRARLRDPRHRGNHGHLPGCDAERSFALLFDEGYRAPASGTILDVAPTVLDLVGCERPGSMQGRPLFEPSGP